MKQETPPDEGHKRVWVEGVWPEIDAGAHPVKRVLGERFVVEVDLIADGHDLLGGALLYRHEQESAWREVRLTAMVNDRWRASFVLDRLGVWHYALEGWVDHAATWLHVLHVKADAGEQSAADLPVELLVGSQLCAAAAERASASPADAVRLRDASRAMARAGTPVAERVALALDPGLAEILARWPDRGRATRYGHELRVSVDRPRAQFSSWYEFFPRSCGPDGKHGTLRDAEARLPYVADMGFDVLYLPPIHPIGRSFRKGRNNTLDPGPEDVGSPWAIGAAEGGHKAVHPQLGTLADLRHFVRAAAQHGIEVALDIAFQAAPDHPWVVEHPAWFKHRPDGSIQYAENPPKKYQDIYPIDFESSDWRALWQELLSVFLFWIDQGVKIFRVDNPHTKSLHFWRWCLAEIKAVHPDTIFLSESFTAPKRMYALAKLGFSQSYTYFTWRNTKGELTAYFRELTGTDVREYFRPNLWPNTPDILHEYLQTGGRPAFTVRGVLAATLGANYGVYGPAFELAENVPREPGSEEYLNSEKYEVKYRDRHTADTLRPFLRSLNRIRHEHPALQVDGTLAFHEADNPLLICYSKKSVDGMDTVVVVVNLDPVYSQSGWVTLDLDGLGLDDRSAFEVHDLLTGHRYLWQGARNYVELSPTTGPAHIFAVLGHLPTERDFDPLR